MAMLAMAGLSIMLGDMPGGICPGPPIIPGIIPLPPPCIICHQKAPYSRLVEFYFSPT
jgi:hypothetical protein